MCHWGYGLFLTTILLAGIGLGDPIPALASQYAITGTVSGPASRTNSFQAWMDSANNRSLSTTTMTAGQQSAYHFWTAERDVQYIVAQVYSYSRCQGPINTPEPPSNACAPWQDQGSNTGAGVLAHEWSRSCRVGSTQWNEQVWFNGGTPVMSITQTPQMSIVVRISTYTPGPQSASIFDLPPSCNNNDADAARSSQSEEEPSALEFLSKHSSYFLEVPLQL